MPSAPDPALPVANEIARILHSLTVERRATLTWALAKYPFSEGNTYSNEGFATDTPQGHTVMLGKWYVGSGRFAYGIFVQGPDGDGLIRASAYTKSDQTDIVRLFDAARTEANAQMAGRVAPVIEELRSLGRTPRALD